MRAALVFATVAIGLHAWSQAPNFQTARFVPTANSPALLVGGDFDKDGNAIAIMYNGVATISKADFSIIKNILIYAAPVNLYGDQFTNSRGYCVDRENGILYFLRRAAQPAPGPYTLASYNLATDEVKAITTNFFYASSIAYDASQKLVIMGDFPPNGSSGGGTVKMYSPLGLLSSQFALPTVPSEILIQ